MRKEKQVLSKETEWYCDICKNIINDRYSSYNCKCCNKDLCNRCSIYDDRDMGDYPDRYCKSCWKVGEPFRKKIEEIKNGVYKEESRLEEEWFQKAKSEQRINNV